MNFNRGRRARSCNFTPEETEKLVSLVAEYRNVIENKTKDAATWQAKKNAWVALMTEYNKSGGTFRDLVHVKMKYEALKRDARKKCQILQERKQAGERIDKAMLLTPLEKKVLNMAMPTEEAETSNDSEQPSESIVEQASEGDETSNDSEQPDPNSVSEEVAATPEESPAKRIKVEQEEVDPLTSTSEQVDQNIAESSQASGKSEEHTASYTLSDEKLETSVLQKSILQEELKEKRLKRQMMEDEMQHKNELHMLAKTEMLLKIEILKTELENKRK